MAALFHPVGDAAVELEPVGGLDGGLVAAGPIAETLTSQNLTRTFGLPLVVEQRGERFTARSLSLD